MPQSMLPFTRRRRIALTSIAAIILVGAYALLKPTMDGAPRSNLGYLAWKHRLRGYAPAYGNLLVRDTEFTRALIGEKFNDVVARYQIPVIDGTTFPTNSYRGEYLERVKHFEPDVRHYWLDDRANNFGVCIRVKNERIEMLWYLKG
jgi:hypothetical protein